MVCTVCIYVCVYIYVVYICMYVYTFYIHTNKKERVKISLNFPPQRTILISKASNVSIIYFTLRVGSWPRRCCPSRPYQSSGEKLQVRIIYSFITIVVVVVYLCAFWYLCNLTWPISGASDVTRCSICKRFPGVWKIVRWKGEEDLYGA